MMKFSKDTIYNGKRIGDASKDELDEFIALWTSRDGVISVSFHEPEKVRYINETINTLWDTN